MGEDHIPQGCQGEVHYSKPNDIPPDVSDVPKSVMANLEEFEKDSER